MLCARSVLRPATAIRQLRQLTQGRGGLQPRGEPCTVRQPHETLLKFEPIFGVPVGRKGCVVVWLGTTRGLTGRRTMTVVGGVKMGGILRTARQAASSVFSARSTRTCPRPPQPGDLAMAMSHARNTAACICRQHAFAGHRRGSTRPTEPQNQSPQMKKTSTSHNGSKRKGQLGKDADAWGNGPVHSFAKQASVRRDQNDLDATELDTGHTAPSHLFGLELAACRNLVGTGSGV